MVRDHRIDGSGVEASLGQGPIRTAGPADVEEGVQVLTRGPVHEAFAETVTFDPEPGIVVPKAPPAAIEELPPDQKPEGANVAWIPGYWGWDDERSDFLWVSGVWRSPAARPPMGARVLGTDQHKAINGLPGTGPTPRRARWNTCPSRLRPSKSVLTLPHLRPTQTWLPGCWIWQQDRYVWRPGFWANVQSDWVWIPAHYVWAPRGYVFVDGYWDYSVARRGVLFAPVYFNSNVYARGVSPIRRGR